MAQFEKKLYAEGLLNDEMKKAIAVNITEQINEAVDFADQSPYPDASELTDYVWA